MTASYASETIAQAAACFSRPSWLITRPKSILHCIVSEFSNIRPVLYGICRSINCIVRVVVEYAECDFTAVFLYVVYYLGFLSSV